MRLLKLIYIEHESSLLLIGPENYMLKVSGSFKDVFKDAIDNSKEIDFSNLGLSQKQIIDLENTILNRCSIKNEFIKCTNLEIEVIPITQEEPQEIGAFAKANFSITPPTDGSACISDINGVCANVSGLDDDSIDRLP